MLQKKSRVHFSSCDPDILECSIAIGVDTDRVGAISGCSRVRPGRATVLPHLELLLRSPATYEEIVSPWRGRVPAAVPRESHARILPATGCQWIQGSKPSTAAFPVSPLSCTTPAYTFTLSHPLNTLPPCSYDCQFAFPSSVSSEETPSFPDI